MGKDWLILIILKDLLFRNKLAILLFLCLLASCAALIWTTNETRKQYAQKTYLLLEKDALEAEYQSIILESNTLIGENIIEERAELLGLEVIDSNETLLIFNK